MSTLAVVILKGVNWNCNSVFSVFTTHFTEDMPTQLYNGFAYIFLQDLRFSSGIANYSDFAW